MYPQPVPRRRKQAIPTTSQMIRRRAASPGGIPPAGAPRMGAPAAPVRRLPTYTGNPIYNDTRQMRLTKPNMQQPLIGGGYDATGDPIDQMGGHFITPPRTNWTPPGAPSAPGTGPPIVSDGWGPGGQPPITGGPTGGPNDGPNNSFGPGKQTKDPNALIGVAGDGRHPLQHLAYWESQGWTYNPTTGRFHQGSPGGAKAGQPPPNPSGGGNGSQGGGGGQGGGNGGGGQGGNNGTPAPPSTQLPLDSYFEAQQRALNDALMARLSPLGPGREQLAADQALQSARLDTNQGVDQRHLDESLAGRGAWGGGIQRRDNGYLGTDYLRQRQDLASQVAQGYAGYGQQESAANAEYQSGLMQALMDLAQRQSVDQHAVTPHPGATLPPQKQWHPTWQPKWHPGGK